jgi:hypothetical protein
MDIRSFAAFKKSSGAFARPSDKVPNTGISSFFFFVFLELQVRRSPEAALKGRGIASAVCWLLSHTLFAAAPRTSRIVPLAP